MGRPGLTIHPKFRRLVHMLGMPAPHVLGHLEYLWIPCYENGNPEIGDSVDIELAAGWVGEPGKLCRALLECGGTGAAGFIEEIPGKPERYQIHDLYDHAPEYVRKRFDREAARQAQGKTLSEIRAEAGRRGGKAKGKQTEANGDHLLSAKQTEANGSKRLANGTPPAPAPAPAHTEGGRKRPVFVKPSAEEVAAYFSQQHLDGDAAEFHDHYTANGWTQGRGKPVKDWHAAARNWSRRQDQFVGRNGSSQNGQDDEPEVAYAN
jgi:hypothetical protein